MGKTRSVRGIVGRILGGNKLSDGFFQLDAIQNHIPATATANDADLTAYAHDTEMLLSAGVRLFQFQCIANLHAYDLHGAPSFLYINIPLGIIPQNSGIVNHIWRNFTIC